jgi:hypothetical protein
VSIDPRVEPYARNVAAALTSLLGDSLVGVYVHGSATLGGFDPGSSDVDVLAVATRRLSATEKRAIGEACSEAALPCPAGGLEMSVVTMASVQSPSNMPPFELHLATKDWSTVVDGAERDGDEDLVLHYAVCRAAGEALSGPDPRLLSRTFPGRRSSGSWPGSCGGRKSTRSGGTES